MLEHKISPYSVENITSFNCLNRKKKVLWSSGIGRESLKQFESRINMLVKAEIPAHLAQNITWREFEPENQNLLFPDVYNGFCLHYAGHGRMLSYNLGRVRAALFATKNNMSMKQCFLTIDKINFASDGIIEELGHIVVNYRNGSTLDIDSIGRFSRWTSGEELICSYDMREHETASELLAAIEGYSEGGELDPRYALFLVKPLGVHLRELDLGQKGRYLDDELGL